MNTTTGTLPSAVNSPADRRLLFRWLLDIGINFHPDTPAAEYVGVSGRRVFDDKLASRLDSLMEEAVGLDDLAYDEGSDMLRQYLLGEMNAGSVVR